MRAPRCPSRVRLLPATQSACGPSSETTPRSIAARSSRRCPRLAGNTRTCLSRSHPSAEPFPQCNSPRSSGPGGAPAYPLKSSPPSQAHSSPSLPPSLAGCSTSSPWGPHFAAASAAELRTHCGAPGGRGAGAPAARSLRSRSLHQRTRHARAPQPSLTPSPDAQSPPAAVAASRERPRGGCKARPQAGTPCDLYGSVTRSLG